MKTSKKIITISLISILLSCSKEDTKTEPVNDCDTKNYGIVTVNYTNLSERHAIDISKTGTSVFFRTKISMTGLANDTIRLKPGSYQLSISRINTAELAIETHPPVQSIITQCSTQLVNTQI